LSFDFTSVSTCFVDASGSAGFTSPPFGDVGSPVGSDSVSVPDSSDVVSSVLSPVGSPTDVWVVSLPVDDADEDADEFESDEESEDSDDFGEGPPVSDGSAEATPVETATPRPTAKVRPLSRDAFFGVTMTVLLCPGDRSLRRVVRAPGGPGQKIYARDNEVRGRFGNLFC
jgi:hypothetical protein